jgi:hypothetical protein
MIHVDDLDHFAAEQKREGFAAEHRMFGGQDGIEIGPVGLDQSRTPNRTNALFFPLWELNDAANEPLVAARRFHEIENRRQRAASATTPSAASRRD